MGSGASVYSIYTRTFEIELDDEIPKVPTCLT